MESKKSWPELPKELIDWINEQLKEYGGGDKTVEIFMTAAFVLLYIKLHQEKRATAIAYQEWAADRGWLLHPDCDENEERAWYKPSDDFDIPDELMFGGQLYDLYLLSLTKTVK